MVEQFRGAVLDRAVSLSAALKPSFGSVTSGPRSRLFATAIAGFNFRQVGATEILEDDASCIMRSENPAIGSARGMLKLECIICGSS